MANKIFQDYQGDVVQIDGVCYYYLQRTFDNVNADPSEVSGVYADCDECLLNSSSSSDSSFMYSSSSSSDGIVVDSSSSSSSGATPSPCAGGDPSIICTVSGASGTINWMGETWNLPADSGTQKEICPTQYTISNATNDFKETWRFATSGGLFNRGGNTFSYVNSANIAPDGGNVADFRKGYTFGGTVTFSSTLNIILTVPFATVNDYRLTDEYFGSYTNGGITYTWTRGNGW